MPQLGVLGGQQHLSCQGHLRELGIERSLHLQPAATSPDEEVLIGETLLARNRSLVLDTTPLRPPAVLARSGSRFQVDEAQSSEKRS
eukprot:CAMPEP_0174241100 /NCGR_PEP_ID=MMETSP0417-20130205/21789_1 /TAXON_ID=242541 /ORGANISM="Mayorella sp, Strain BSH-02190019" /LENGTH=86 /DNA_ID=CAMNT_0015320295 /DNA_START=60 /DNA_END=321 /DNA_ORIENTATION=-